MSRFYCELAKRILCRSAGEVREEPESFWAWEYFWTLRCPECENRHPSLDRHEYAGTHPWQRDQETAEARRWLSRERELVRYPPRRLPRVPLESISDADIDATWSANAEFWEAGYDERGDRNRKYQSDPVLFDCLGPVSGLRVLDAGSGGGYLSRLLARQGAAVVAVENSSRLHEIALGHQRREPLDIEFLYGSISNMRFLPTENFDRVVANYVLMDVRDYEAAIAEIARVLKPRGLFICVLSHNSLDGAWHIPAPDSPRPEDRAAWTDDDYFIRRAGYIQWGNLKPFVSFHRPLRDYITACKRSGLELRDLDEPEISEEGERELPAHRVRLARRVPFSYVLMFQKAGQ